MQVLEKQMLREAYRVSMTVDLLEEKSESAVQPRTQNLEQKTAAYSFGDWMKVVSGKAPESAKEEKAVQQKQKQRSLIISFSKKPLNPLQNQRRNSTLPK